MRTDIENSSTKPEIKAVIRVAEVKRGAGPLYKELPQVVLKTGGKIQ